MNTTQHITKTTALFAMLMLALLASRMSYAQVPLMVNYQGKLEMSGSAYNGTGYFKFALIDNSTTPTTNYWTNDGSVVSAGAEPASAVTLPVNLGFFSVKLGNTSLTNMSALPTSAFGNANLYLRVWFSADGIAYEQLNPDRQLVSVPYAMHADSADSVTGNVVTSIVAGTGVTLTPSTGVGDVTISVTGAGTASSVVCTNCVDSLAITDGTITTADMAFDTATQAELDAHKTSADHDGRYFTQSQLSTSSPGSNRVHWDNLTGVPAGFADGVDNVGSGTVTSVATGSGLTGGPITGSGTLSIATGGVTSTMIGDGEIANADISATAAIAGSKITPNFGSQALTAGSGSFTGLSATTMSASGTLGIPTSTTPTLTTDGQVALKSGTDAINIQAGSAVAGGVPAHTDVAIPLIHQKDITLLQPDQIQVVSSTIPFITVDSFNYPNGITITAIRLATSASSSLAINVENWTSPTDVAPVTISNIATSASTEQTNTTITNPVVAAGNYVFLNLGTTAVNWAKVTIWYYVNN